MCLMTPACIKVEFLSHWFGWYKFHHENSPNRQKHRAKNSYNCLDSFHHFWLKSWAKIDVNELWKWPCFMNQQSCINLSFALLCLWYELWKILGAVCGGFFCWFFISFFFFLFNAQWEKCIFKISFNLSSFFNKLLCCIYFWPFWNILFCNWWLFLDLSLQV